MLGLKFLNECVRLFYWDLRTVLFPELDNDLVNLPSRCIISGAYVRVSELFNMFESLIRGDRDSTLTSLVD